MEMLQLNDLHKTFNPGTVNEKVALAGVSLQMEAGDFATIVGSNGAGKSTLFNAITGGFIADEGSILLPTAALSPTRAAFCWAGRTSPLRRSTSAARSSGICSRTRSRAPHPT